MSKFVKRAVMRSRLNSEFYLQSRQKSGQKMTYPSDGECDTISTHKEIKMKKLTPERISRSIEIASRLGQDRHVTIMADLKAYYDSKGTLSDRQRSYLESLMSQYNEETLEQAKSYKDRFVGDKEYRSQLEVVAKYYHHGGNGYFSRTAAKVLIALGFGDTLPDHHLPDFGSVRKMMQNKYAEKVLDSHNHPPLYSAGDLVMIRSTGVSRIWSQRKYSQEQQAGIENLNSHPCFIIKVDAKPITDALKYKPKQGGTRVYSVMPIGTTLIYYILECDLKQNRIPKAKQ